MTYPITVTVYKGWGFLPNTIYIAPLYYTFNFEVRGFTRREYGEWQHECSDLVEFEGKLLKECVVVGPTHFDGKLWDWDECFAGVAEQVLEKIYNLSGYGSAPDLEITRPVEAYLNSPEARFDLVIMTAYNYKLSELMDMDQVEYHKILGSSQMKLEMMEIDTEAILYPERAKKRKGRVAVPRGRAAMEGMDPGVSLTTTTPHGTPAGGAKPFFSGAGRGRDPHSRYPPGHPKNPALMEDRKGGILPGATGATAFYSE